MEEMQQYQVLSLLKAKFTSSERKLEQIYWQDPVFRQIAREYYECIHRRDAVTGTIGTGRDIYADTINELHDELLGYIKNDNSLLQGK